MRNCGSITGRLKKFFGTSRIPDQSWVLLTFIINWYPGIFPWGSNRPFHETYTQSAFSGEVENLWSWTLLPSVPAGIASSSYSIWIPINTAVWANSLGNSNLQHQLTVLLTSCYRRVIIMLRHHDIGPSRDISDVDCSRYCS